MNCGKLCEALSSGFKKTIRIICPLLYCVIYSRREEYRCLKIIAGFFYGLLLGLALHELILVDLDFTPNICLVLGGVICLLIGLGNAISIQIRCISMLTLPSFCGRSGRGVLKTMLLAYILAGPIQNIVRNAREVVQVFACSTVLTYNLTRARYELLLRPFSEAILNIKADTRELRETFRSVNGVIMPITEELEGEAEMRKIKEENDYLDEIQGDTKRQKEIEDKYKEVDKEPEASKYEKRYERKLESRCEDMISKGVLKCRRMFNQAYDKCYGKVSWMAAWFLCWPMKLTFVCNIVEAMGGNKPCDPSKMGVAGFGEGYSYLKNSRNAMMKGLEPARIQYLRPHIPQLVNVKRAADIAKAVMDDFKKRKAILETLMTITKRILSFIFITIILSSQKYHDNYLSDIEFDNVYVTRYFRHIDARRRKRNQHTLLPFKKIERPNFIDPYAALPGKTERKNLVFRSLKLILQVLMATTFILIDHVFYETLDIVRRHARVEFTQEGSHDLSIQVHGTGMLAKLVRSVLGGFNIRQRIKNVTGNEECLPRPAKLQKYYIYKIYGIYLAIWLLLYLETYTMRFPHAICGYFYPKREKRRVLFLYNDTLKKRRGLFKFMKAKVRRMVREQRLEFNANLLLMLRIRYPNYCGWLHNFAAARQQCLICEEPEPRSSKKAATTFVTCPNPECHFIYCRECWKDIEETCFACKPSDDSDDDDDDGEEDWIG